jgi:hypothetical protein
MVIGKFFTNTFILEIAAEDSASVLRFGDYESAIIAS